MSKRLPCRDNYSELSAIWTALEFFRSIEPYRIGLMPNPTASLATAVRQAHAIAVADGYDWDPKGEYPVSVWMQLKP